MNTGTLDPRCFDCLMKTYRNLFTRFGVDEETRQIIEAHLNELLKQGNIETTPEFQRELGRKFALVTGIEDPFREEKAQSNRVARELCNEWKPLKDN